MTASTGGNAPQSQPNSNPHNENVHSSGSISTYMPTFWNRMYGATRNNEGVFIYESLNQSYTAYNWMVNRQPYDLRGVNVGYSGAQSAAMMSIKSFATGPLATEFNAIFEAAKISNIGVTGYRYMSQGELDAILDGPGAGYLRGGRSGETYFTKDLYKSSLKAKARLSLKTSPEFRVEFEIINDPNFIRSGTKVKPQFGNTGKGAEWMTTDPVQVKIINWQPLGK